MAFERDKYSSLGTGAHVLGTVVEYDPSRNGRGGNAGLLKWSVILVAVAMAAASLVWRGCFRRKPAPVAPVVSASPVQIAGFGAEGGSGAVATNAPPGAPESKNGSPLESKAPERKAERTGTHKRQVADNVEARRWVEESSGRPARERTLLERLADAEEQGRLEIAVDTIELLRARPSMADLDDKLARRLGDLNIRRLYSGSPVPWVVEVTVRKGQTVHRIAREHGTTVAAVRRLNGMGAKDEPAAGAKLRVLEFPKATFVVHKHTRYADLTLNGKLFKRYYVGTRRGTKTGAYPITSKGDEGPRARFSALGVRVAPADMLELDMFLGPGSMLTIAEM